MVVLRTDLSNTKELARRERFEPIGNITATNVQEAIQQASGSFEVGTARLPAAAVTVNILAADIEVGINTGTAPTSCPLPSVAAWAAANPNGLELVIFDYTGNAATNNVTPSLNGTDIFVQGVTPIIKSGFGGFALRPIIPASGPNAWYVRETD